MPQKACVQDKTKLRVHYTRHARARFTSEGIREAMLLVVVYKEHSCKDKTSGVPCLRKLIDQSMVNNYTYDY